MIQFSWSVFIQWSQYSIMAMDEPLVFILVPVFVVWDVRGVERVENFPRYDVTQGLLYRGHLYRTSSLSCHIYLI